MIFDVNEIQKLLPHRYPFLMIDGILEMERLKRIVGVKNVTNNEYYFQGHFPHVPLMPGVLVVEAMAQTAAMLVMETIGGAEIAGGVHNTPAPNSRAGTKLRSRRQA